MEYSPIFPVILSHNLSVRPSIQCCKIYFKCNKRRNIKVMEFGLNQVNI